MNPKRHIVRCKIKNKERTLKATQQKHLVTHKEAIIRLQIHLSAEILQARKEYDDIVTVLEISNFQPKTLLFGKTDFKHKGDIKTS